MLINRFFYLPLGYVELETHLPLETVLVSLEENTARDRGFLRNPQTTAFVGVVSSSGITVRLNRLTASSARPIFRGSVSRREGATCLKGRLCVLAVPWAMICVALVLLAAVKWLAALAIASVIGVVASVSYRREARALVDELRGHL